MRNPQAGIGDARNAGTLVHAKVTYTVEYDGQVHIVEHVPAKVSQETRRAVLYARDSGAHSCLDQEPSEAR